MELVAGSQISFERMGLAKPLCPRVARLCSTRKTLIFDLIFLWTRKKFATKHLPEYIQRELALCDDTTTRGKPIHLFFKFRKIYLFRSTSTYSHAFLNGESSWCSTKEGRASDSNIFFGLGCSWRALLAVFAATMFSMASPFAPKIVKDEALLFLGRSASEARTRIDSVFRVPPPYARDSPAGTQS